MERGMQMNFLKEIKNIAAVIISVCFCMFCAINWNMAERDILFVIIVFVASMVLICKGLGTKDKRIVLLSSVFSAVFSFFAVNSGAKYANAATYIVLFAAFWVMSAGAMTMLENTADIKLRRQNKKIWAGIFAAMVLLWMPAFMACGPIAITQDSTTVIKEALGLIDISDANPVLYTFLVRMVFKPFYDLGISLIVPAYIFGFLQLLTVAAVLSYLVYFIYSKGCNMYGVAAAFAYFTVTPVFVLNSITMWKDITYNAVLLLLMIQLWEMAQTKGRIFENRVFVAKLAVTSLLACFLRGNGFLVVAAVTVAGVVAFSGYRKRIAVIMLPLLIAVKIITGPVYAAMGIGNLGAIESMAMPIQQVAAAVCADTPLTDEQTQILESYMEIEKWKEHYVPASVDHIKFSGDFEREGFDEKKGDLIKVWLQLAPDNFKTYVRAWLEETKGYWSMSFHSRAVMGGGYFEVLPQIVNKDLILKFTGIKANDWFYSQIQYMPLGIPVFITIFAMFIMICRKKYQYIVNLVPILATWIGLMAGAPTYADGRYILVVMYALPLVIFEMFYLGKNG